MEDSARHVSRQRCQGVKESRLISIGRRWRPLARPRCFSRSEGPVKLEAGARAERSRSKAVRMAAQKKFLEFCGNSREVPARSTLEGSRVLIPLPPNHQPENKCTQRRSDWRVILY